MRTRSLVAPLTAVALGLALPLLAPQRGAASESPTDSGLPATWTIDGVHSSVVFRTKHLDVANFYGTFETISGELTYDPAKPEESSISFAVDAASVDSRNGQRDGHLKGSDFFSAAEFPQIEFTSKKVKAKSEGKLEVTGELEFRGVTKELTVEVLKTGERDTGFQGYKAGFETSFEIDMQDFEVPFVRDKGGIGPEVTLFVAIEAARE